MVQILQGKKHGSHSTYSKGCRCEPCTVAHRIYTRDILRRYRREKQGLEPLRDPKYIDATETRLHLQYLSKNGMGSSTVSELTGMHMTNIQKIRTGKQASVAVETADKILGVHLNLYGKKEFVDSSYAKKLVKEIRDAGYLLADINKALGMKALGGAVITGDYIHYEKMLKIEAVHFALLRHPPKALRPYRFKRLKEGQ